jgi:glucosyl-3-phosphoglycerate synthase
MFADADTADFEEHFVYGTLGPLLADPQLQFVKAAFRRPFKQGEEKILDGGGRVTELMAKPLINLFYPELAGFVQPLAGEFAARREVLSSVPFFTGYGVEIGMLIDVFDQVGLAAMAQVDLGTRQNNHQSLASLSRMSSVVLRTVAAREGLGQRHAGDLEQAVPGLWEQPDTYLHAVGTEEGLRLDEHLNELVERPPLASLSDDSALSTIV